MATIHISHQFLPIVRSSVKFRKTLLSLKLSNYRTRLHAFEKKYHMTTSRFCKEFQAGRLQDLQDFIEWEYLAESYEHLHEDLQQLKRIKL